MKQMRLVTKYVGAVLVVMAFTSLWAQQVIKVPRLKWQRDLQDTAVVRADTVELPLSLPGMLVEGRDTLSVNNGLEMFFAGLDSLRVGKDTILNVVHLGDSHIQAGYYSGQVMRLLQEAFGNAGRGWIAPYKLSRTNEPADYRITSVVRNWLVGRCTQREQRRKAPIGPGGLGIQVASPSINLDVSVTPKNGAGYSFSRAILYRGNWSMPMLPAGKNKAQVTYLPADTLCAEDVLADTFLISSPVDTLELQSSRRKPGTDRLMPAAAFRNVYFGLSLQNGNPGILYHSVGLNGAMYVNYTDSSYVAKLACLEPDLLILSMGTNESFGPRFQADEFASQVRAFLRLVKHQMPHTAILLTTPPECYRRVTVNKKRVYERNKNTEAAARTLVRVAREEQVACWDLFTATGGKNSCRKWYDHHLMGRDRIHFSQEGYQEHGTLLFRSLMNAYNHRK